MYNKLHWKLQLNEECRIKNDTTYLYYEEISVFINMKIEFK